MGAELRAKMYAERPQQSYYLIHLSLRLKLADFCREVGSLIDNNNKDNGITIGSSEVLGAPQ